MYAKKISSARSRDILFFTVILKQKTNRIMTGTGTSLTSLEDLTKDDIVYLLAQAGIRRVDKR